MSNAPFPVTPDSPAATALRVVEIDGKVSRLVDDMQVLTTEVRMMAPAINDIGHFSKSLERAFDLINANSNRADSRWTEHQAEVLRKEEKADVRWDEHQKEYKQGVKFTNQVMGGLIVASLIVGSIATMSYNAVSAATTARTAIVATHDQDQRANVSRFEADEIKQAETAVLANDINRRTPK